MLPEFKGKRKFEVENRNTWHNSTIVTKFSSAPKSEPSSYNTNFNNKFQNKQNNYARKSHVPKEGKRSSNYRHDGNKKEYNGNKSDLDYWFILD